MHQTTKRILCSVAILLIALLSIPFGHILRTKMNEPQNIQYTPKGYRNDASQLNLTKVNKLVDVAVDPIELQQQLREVLQYARSQQLKVSIAGATHSMGGHTIYPNGISINMLPYKQMHFDPKTHLLTIGSGALWEDALHYLDDYGKSIMIMQSFSNFSIGGSMSVNGHGWQKGAAPLASSVESFTLMNAKGEILNCSRQENPELFKLVIGGYGLFGIILDVKLRVVDNVSLKFHSRVIAPKEYVKTYVDTLQKYPNIEFAYGRLRITDKHFLEQATFNYFEKMEQTPLHLVAQKQKNAELKRMIFRGSVDSEYGKRLRWDLENSLNQLTPYATFSRNEILSEHTYLIENKYPNSTDLLHEYFIPKVHLNAFVEEIRPILKKHQIDLLNITIREVKKDQDSWMHYANEDVFALVFLFNQKKTQKQEQQMRVLTNQLLDVALKYKGTFYLPYRLHISRDKMRLAYPQADQFFALKKKYDPEEIFSNQFYVHYR